MPTQESLRDMFLKQFEVDQVFEDRFPDFVAARSAMNNLHTSFVYLPKKKFSERFLDASWDNVVTLREFLMSITKEDLKELIYGLPEGSSNSPYDRLASAAFFRVKQRIKESEGRGFKMELKEFRDLRDKHCSTSSLRSWFSRAIDMALCQAFPYCIDTSTAAGQFTYYGKDRFCHLLAWYHPIATNKKGKQYAKPLVVEYNPNACTTCTDRVKCLEKGDTMKSFEDIMEGRL